MSDYRRWESHPYYLGFGIKEDLDFMTIISKELMQFGGNRYRGLVLARAHIILAVGTGSTSSCGRGCRRGSSGSSSSDSA